MISDAAHNILEQHPNEAKKVSLPVLWPYRLLGNILILVMLSFGCLGIIMIKSNFVGQKLNSLSDYIQSLTSYLGFTVEDILIYGCNKTSLEEINNIISTKYGDNILYIDIHNFKKELEQLPWIKSVTVQRSYFPNILQINIKEKKVQSLWQINNTFYPIDTDGSVIHSEFIPSQPLLLIIGNGAPEHINDLIKIVNTDKELANRIKVANFISKRRWNIILDDIENGITIKLPESNLENAWKKLIKLNKTQGILKRKLTIIDLRFEDKVLVKPRKLSIEEKIKKSLITTYKGKKSESFI
jgi:cell division protein FtsQ